MITSGEKNQIRTLLQSPQWQTVESLANELIAKINADPKVSDKQWITLRKVLLGEGEVNGIKRLIRELYKAAQHE